MPTINKNDSQIAQETVEGAFGSTNVIAIMAPVGDYEWEGMLARLLSDAQLQLKGENYSRLVVQLALPEETPETFAFLDVLHAAAKCYPEDVYVVGNTTSGFDLSSSFSNGNLLISILTIVFVILLLGDIIIERTAIPTLGGTFMGNNHTISGLSLTDDGSHQGLFRYLQPGGQVTGLTVRGTVAPGGGTVRAFRLRSKKTSLTEEVFCQGRIAYPRCRLDSRQ